MLAGRDSAILAAQPLPVEQMSPGELGTGRVLASLSIASRCRRSALSPSLKSARQRACIPRPQSVLDGAVAAITRSSAPAATSNLEVRTAASISKSVPMG